MIRWQRYHLYRKKLNQQLVHYDMFHDLFSIDKAMVPYYGRHSCKMFYKGKPIRLGYTCRLWCLCGNYGYPYHLIIYKGKDITRNMEPLGLQVVGKMVSVIEQYSKPTHHEMFFDNFFTSHGFMQILASQ